MTPNDITVDRQWRVQWQAPKQTPPTPEEIQREKDYREYNPSRPSPTPAKK